MASRVDTFRDGDDRICRPQEAGHHQCQKPAVHGLVGLWVEEENEVVEGKDGFDAGEAGQ